MTEKNLKAFFVLAALFFLDLARPFGYSLLSEFLFLGIVFIAINYPLRTALIFSIIFGYLKSAASTSGGLFSVFEYSLITIAVHYFLYNFRKSLAFFIIFFGALLVHIIANSLYVSRASWFFVSMFIIHSSAAFLLLNYILSSWLKIPHANNE